MSLHRRNWVLLAVVVVCFGLELLLRPDKAPPIDRTPVFEGLNPRVVQRLRIEAPGTDRPLVLERVDNAWVLSSQHGFPAHTWVVEDLLSRLRGLNHSDRVSDDAGAALLFGFDGSERSITIEGEGARMLAQLHVAPGPQGRGSHVRPLNHPDIYRAPAIALVEPDPKRFVKADLFEFDPALLKSIELELASEETLARVERVGDGRWRKASGELLSPAKLDPLIAWASHLYLQEVVAAAPVAAHGIHNREEGGSWARLRLVLEDGERELLLGNARPATEGGLGERYATCSTWDTPWVVTVSPLTAERLSQLARALAR